MQIKTSLFKKDNGVLCVGCFPYQWQQFYCKKICRSAGFSAFALNVWGSWLFSFGIWVLGCFFMVILVFGLFYWMCSFPWWFTVSVSDFIVLVKDYGQSDPCSCLEKGLWFWALPWDFDQRLHSFTEQKLVLQSSACHQPTWDGTALPVRGGRMWHFSEIWCWRRVTNTPQINNTLDREFRVKEILHSCEHLQVFPFAKWFFTMNVFMVLVFYSCKLNS